MGNYKQPGTIAPKKEVPQVHAYVSPDSAPVGNHVQAGTESRPVSVQQGRPHVSSPAVSANYQQPDVRREAVETQTAKPFAAIAAPSPSNYVQPQHTPAPLTEQVALPHPHNRKKLIAQTPGTPYTQPGTPTFPTQYDAGIVTYICPYCSAPSRHTGSTVYPFRCDSGHQYGPSGLGVIQGPTGTGAVITGAPELGTGNQLAPGVTI